MSEWLGKPRVSKEDIEKAMPSMVTYFPALTRYYIEDQRMRLILVLDEEEREGLVEAITKTYSAFTPENLRKATREAVGQWVKKHK